jgi:hypothetical protein
MTDPVCGMQAGPVAAAQGVVAAVVIDQELLYND